MKAALRHGKCNRPVAPSNFQSSAAEIAKLYLDESIKGDAFVRLERSGRPRKKKEITLPTIKFKGL